MLTDCKTHIGDHQTFYRRVGGGVYEHHRAAQRARFFQRILKIEVVVVFKPHTAEYDDINLSLHRDTCEQLVVGFTGA